MGIEVPEAEMAKLGPAKKYPVEVTLEIDDQPRVLEWEKAKSQETRDKNLAKIIAAL